MWDLLQRVKENPKLSKVSLAIRFLSPFSDHETVLTVWVLKDFKLQEFKI